MEIKFTSGLTGKEIEEIHDFYPSLRISAIEQHPQWNELFATRQQKTYFIAKEENKIISFAIIEEKGWGGMISSARIEFGPLFKEFSDSYEILKQIINHYKQRKRFVYLSVQLVHPTGPQIDLLEARLNQQFRIRYLFNNENKSSYFINLTPDEEQVFQNFHRGRKRAIKKSVEEGLTVTLNNSTEDIEKFGLLYNRMNQRRKLGRNEANTRREFTAISNFLKQNNLGYTLLVRNRENEVVGGVFLVAQGETLRAFRGCDQLHFSLWEGMKIAKKAGFRYFDLWGYNHYAKEGEQAFQINHFKSLFGGEFIFFPKRMHISLIPFGFQLHRTLLALKNLIRK